MAINQLQKGATLERKIWLAKIRRLKSKCVLEHVKLLNDLLAFGTAREPRTRNKPRGL